MRGALILALGVAALCACNPATRCGADGGCPLSGRCIANFCVVPLPKDGTAAEHAAQSCRAILETGDGGQGSGAYWIDPDSEGPHGPVQLYCDMDAGWTLIGKVDGQHAMYDEWLRADVNVERLSSPQIEDAGYSCVDAIWLAVNGVAEVRLSNSDLSRWTRWRMTGGRTIETWWRHDAGIGAVYATTPDAGVTVFLHDGTQEECLQNIYGLNAGGAHGGGYPSTYRYHLAQMFYGYDVPNDRCMTAAVQLPGTEVHAFQHNGNGRDAPRNELDWPNQYISAAPHVSVWVR
jgi:hypothetical protein